MRAGTSVCPVKQGQTPQAAQTTLTKVALSDKMGLVADSGQFLREDGKLERGEVRAGRRLRPSDVHRVSARQKRSTSGRAPEICVVPVQDDPVMG